jgi:hypothetical protein
MAKVVVVTTENGPGKAPKIKRKQTWKEEEGKTGCLIVLAGDRLVFQLGAGLGSTGWICQCAQRFGADGAVRSNGRNSSLPRCTCCEEKTLSKTKMISKEVRVHHFWTNGYF